MWIPVTGLEPGSFAAGERFQLSHRRDYGDISLATSGSPTGPWQSTGLVIGKDFACGMARFGEQVVVPYAAGDRHVCLGTLDPYSQDAATSPESSDT